MSEELDYNELKTILHSLNTDDTISSAHGILCGFACVKPDITLDDWLGEVLIDIDMNNINHKTAHEQLAQIFNTTISQLSDATLDFNIIIADDDYALAKQADTLAEWCQGFLLGLGLKKINTNDKEVLEMIKDFSEISKIETQILDNDKNTNDFVEIIEFVRIGVLFIQETLQPSKQNYIPTDTIH